MRFTPGYLKQEKTALLPLEILQQEQDRLTPEEKKETEKTIGRLLAIRHRKAFFRLALSAIDGCSEFWNPNVANKRDAPDINAKQRTLTLAKIRTSLRALLAIKNEKRSAAEQEELMRALQQKMEPLIANAETLDNISPFVPESITRSESERDPLMQGDGTDRLDTLEILPEKTKG